LMSTTMLKSAAVDPSRLTRFVGTSLGGHAMTLSRPQSSYNPTTSWDGMAENPRPFARLEVGPRVMMEGVMGQGRPMAGTVLGGEVTRQSAIPVPPAKVVADGGAGVFGGGPLGCPENRLRTASHPEDALTLRTDSFRNYGLKGEYSRAVQVPRAVAGTGAMLTPADRLTMMEFEKQNLQAKRVRHKAEMDHKRMVQIMRCRNPQGAVGMDGLSVPQSEAYGAQGARRAARDAKSRKHAGARRSRLAQVENSVSSERCGLLEHDAAIKPPRQTDFLQRNNRAARIELNTHNRVFDTRPVVVNAPRAQKLRNEDLGGKAFNPVANTRILSEHASVPERMNHRQAHPSQAKLERGAHYKGILNATGL